jgi:shikimate kinase
MLIFLIGFMGSGKSRIGKDLAKLLRYKFIDTDALIEKRRKRSINKIFEKDGEEFFREIEKKTLLKLIKEKNTVIATGGGMPIYSDNMEIMKSNGLTIYLESGVGFLFHRLVGEKKHRPLINKLTDVELMEYIMSTLGNRRAVYEQAALKVNGEKITALKLKEKIAKKKVN